jgi:hypothetical protein
MSSGPPKESTNRQTPPRFHAAAREHSGNKPLFVSPPPAGRKITAGFSFLQRIGKSASIDVWFPDQLQKELNQLIAEGGKLGPDNFPAEWAAVRQFELLQDAGNYKIYDMHAEYITRSLYELTRSMRGGGYRVTVATIGSYVSEKDKDDLEILDKNLQKRISRLIHMLYLEEQSETINKATDETLAAGTWDFQSALPHVGATLGARDLFRPVDATTRQTKETLTIPSTPHRLQVSNPVSWVHDLGVVDSAYDQPFVCVTRKPKAGQYSVHKGIYQFASADTGREITLCYMHNASGAGQPRKLSTAEHKHTLARQFFDILDLLPQNQIVHDTAVGLQLPEMISEQEWIYLTQSDETVSAFNTLLKDVFAPFDGINMGALDGRENAASEVKATTQHLRGHGDRLTPESDQFYRNLAQYAPH